MKSKCSLGIFFLVLFFIAGWADESGVVNIVPEGKAHFAKIGDPLNIDCYVLLADKDEPSLKWATPTRDSVVISAKSDFQSDYVKVLKRLQIKSLTKEHFGTYKCSYKTSSASFELYNLLTEEKTADKYEYNKKFGHGNDAKLLCDITVAGLQVEKVEWLRKDTLVTELDKPGNYIQSLENKTLEIKNPIRKDGSLYIARYTFKNSDSTYDCSVPFLADPLIIAFEKSKNLIEGDDLDLRCQVDGYPPVPIVWMKDKKELNMADHERMFQGSLNGFNNASLLIKDVTFDDAGDYLCKIMHPNVNENQTLTVRVKDKLAALWPFLGIVCEVIVLCIIIFIYEKRHNKQAENEANVQDVDGSATEKKEGLRHRNTQSNNPTA